MLDVRAFTYGLALGAGSMFLFDPRRGATRRARLRDASRHIVHEAQHAMRVGTRDLENRTRGVGARARGLLSSSEEPLEEDVVVARVRSRLGRVTTHAHAIEVRFKEGSEIELKGPALASEHDRIVHAASRVRGVACIDDDLVLYEDGRGVPGLQGGGRHRSGVGNGRPPAAKLLLGAASAFLLATPLAPTVVKAVLYATLRSLLHDGVLPREREREEERGAGAKRLSRRSAGTAAGSAGSAGLSSPAGP